MTTYNRAEWLPKSIGSVLSQTYSNWELIIWNDGSMDNTEGVIKTFSDKRIKYYYEQNHGMSFALNRSIELTKGKYIAFLDDDDEWMENKLNFQVDILEKHETIDILFGNYINVDHVSNDSFLCFDRCQEGLNNLETIELDENINIIINGIPEGLLLSNYIAPSVVILKKELLNKTENFCERLKSAMDLELWWRLGLANIRFAYAQDVLMKRNFLPTGLSRSNIITYQSRVLCYDLALEEIKKNNRMELFPYIKRAYKYPLKMLIHDYALNGNRKAAMYTFNKSYKLGLIGCKEIYYLIGAFAGARLSRWITSIK